MPKQPSRREILGAAAIGMAAVVVPLASARKTGPDAMKTKLAKPLSAEAEKLLTEALKGVETAAKDRLKTKLPENSEPCFTYFPSAREVRSK